MEQGTLAQLEFVDAANAWLEIHQRYIAARTLRDYRQYIRALAKFFGGMTINQVHIGNIREYQMWRKVVPTLVNAELCTLQQILKEARRWDQISPFYKPLPIPSKGSGRSISPSDQGRLIKVAFSRPRWKLAAHCIQIMLMTGLGFGELKSVTRGHVDLEQMTLTIPEEGAKNKDRERTIPINSTAMESICWLVGRWKALGGTRPHEYLLPHNGHNEDGGQDVSRPMYGIDRAWRAIREEWADGDPHLLKFRIYDCRVTAITKTLASGKVSLHTAKKLYGHVSEAMQKRYYKPDIQVLRDAVALLDAPVQRTGKKDLRDHMRVPVSGELPEVPGGDAEANGASMVRKG